MTRQDACRVRRRTDGSAVSVEVRDSASPGSIDASVVPRMELPARPRILVVSLRRIGDLLLTTPLVRSVRRAWPDAAIDMLAFGSAAGIVKGNPDIDRVIAIPARPSVGQTFALLARLWKRYDLAISTQSGDRPTVFALAAG